MPEIHRDIRNRRTVYMPIRREPQVRDLEILTVFDCCDIWNMMGARRE